jgi:hypothetical protein
VASLLILAFVIAVMSWSYVDQTIHVINVGPGHVRILPGRFEVGQPRFSPLAGVGLEVIWDRAGLSYAAYNNYWEFYGSLLWPLGVSAGISMISVYKYLRHRSQTGCPTCGYDLRATPDRCPECGRQSSVA